MRNFWLNLTLLCGGLVLLPPLAPASVVLQMSDKEMAQKASKIVRGKVVRRYSQWDKQHKRIYTYTILAVLDPIKTNGPTQEVTVRQMGGIRGDLGMKVSGSAKFRLGEEVVVFLESIQQTKFHHIMGMSMGKYRVLTDPKTNVRYLTRNLQELHLATRKTRKLVNGHHLQHKKTPLKLETFVQRIRTYLAEIPKLQPKLQPKPKPSLQVQPKPSPPAKAPSK